MARNQDPFTDGPETQHMLSSPTRPTRSQSTSNFVSSPLNPGSPISPFARSRPGSSAALRFPSDDMSSSPFSSISPSTRGSMVLYRLADRDSLVPPKINNRHSVMSSSGSSVASLNLDSKYPSGFSSLHERGMVPYAYDPAMDEMEPPDEEDMLHDPANEKAGVRRSIGLPWRGMLNVGVLLCLVGGLLCLFVFYPVLSFYKNNARNLAIDGNIRINGTGQSPVLFGMPELIDSATPDSAKTRTGFDGQSYSLVFSDEFNVDGRTFYPGDDPFWEAVDLWYGATGDLEWYDPSQVTTKNGSLVITMEDTGPPSPNKNHNLQYKSGMLQSWNKFCFTSGYIEVSVVLPGPNSNTQGYWPGAWTMGNLARPGYGGTTDGTWPYTYDSCDVGTFPNQTLKDGSGPAAALHSDQSQAKYNNALSWLPGQRLSACSCPGSDHPGPSVSTGRGAPEIDVLECELNKITLSGQVASQSAQFAPFAHDYVYNNATTDEWQVWDPTVTNPNKYHGSAVQQAVSALTVLPDGMFQGSGQQFTSMGFEYWANPANRQEGFITWQTEGQQRVRMGAAAVGPDQGSNGSGVSSRLISEEPMAIILNLGMSPNWQTINLATMVFPATYLVDYVRVYQRDGAKNIGCDPKDYPTANYINSHLDMYTNVNATSWGYTKPLNSLYDGC